MVGRVRPVALPNHLPMSCLAVPSLYILATAAFTLVFAAPAAAVWGLRGIVLGVVLGELVLAFTLWIQWRRHSGAVSTSRQERPLAETVID